LLHFRAFIRVLEVHDFTPPEDSSDDGHPPSGESSDDDGYPGYDPGRGSLQPWPSVSRSVPVEISKYLNETIVIGT
jgi:hypothetical protein